MTTDLQVDVQGFEHVAIKHACMSHSTTMGSRWCAYVILDSLANHQLDATPVSGSLFAGSWSFPPPPSLC
jgi:hypothetical protein